MERIPTKVLIADDEPIARGMLRRALEDAGYAVTPVADGAEALDELRRGSFQLVVSDWEMPNMSGIDLCRAIRSGAFEQYIYFIMLTSHDRPQDVVTGLGAGADDFVTKPFNPTEVAVRLRAGERLLTLASTEMTIFVLARLAESRDPETGAHLERVRAFCQILAQQLNRAGEFGGAVTEQYVNLIYQTSPLHDIGKVAIPDCVLLKTGKLDPEEFEVMKTHAVQGARTLEAAMERYPDAGFLRMARDVALSHHEKFDGTGYPFGLVGKAIPLAARIVAVADVYDALRSRRVYKPPFTHEAAHEIISKGAGAHFDPVVVDAYLASERAFGEICERYADEVAFVAA